MINSTTKDQNYYIESKEKKYIKDYIAINNKMYEMQKIEKN